MERQAAGGDVLDRIARTVAELTAIAGDAPVTGAELAQRLSCAAECLLDVDFGSLDVDEVRHMAPQMQQQLFSATLAVRGAIGGWDAAGLMAREVLTALLGVFRAARVAIDMLGEIYLHHPRLAPGQAAHAAFSPADPCLLINPAFATPRLELRPGDVILQRGMLHNSAAIARMGDNDSQFSHVGIVARDVEGHPIIVEALIEAGAVVTPLGRALGHHVGRAVLLRHRDSALASRAARMIREHVAASLAARRPILYDFTMEIGGYERLFCSKLVRLAYDLGSDGGCLLPAYTTRIDVTNRDFLDRIGVTARETFAPGDLEIDWRFDIVAEWRDYRVTSELRLKDLIMTKLLEWMEVHGYALRPDAAIVLTGVLGRASTHLPEAAQVRIQRMVARVPPNMSRKAIEAVAMLHKTAEKLYRPLATLEDETIRATARPLHPRQVLEELERMRQRTPARLGHLVRPRRSRHDGGRTWQS